VRTRDASPDTSRDAYHSGRPSQAYLRDEGQDLGFRPMRKFVFTALAFTAMFWGSTAGTLWQAPQEHPTMKEVSAAWSMTETMAAPDLSINVR
jgi:hypothetical protein